MARRRLLLVIALVAACLPGVAAAAPDATVVVNAKAALATVPDTAIGVNHAIWDGQLGTNAVNDLLGDAGVRMMRYPGGSYGDIYHWKDHTAPGGYVAPNTDFDTFMAGVRRAQAQPIIIANYGTGTPQEAADWVHYANVTKGYGVKYWEIGNELYGNGHYGANWEADNHPDKSPAGYARETVAFAQAMKAADPTIKVGAVLTTPANWPDAIVGTGDASSWNQTVLSIAGPHVDFVIVHWYPGGSTTAQSLASADQVPDMMYLLRRQITQYAGPDADRLGIAMTEMNATYGRNTQPGALFAAEAYTSLLENGVFTVDWWNVHNGATKASTVAGQPDFDDFGLLSSGTCLENGPCEPALNTPFAPYHALKMLSLFASPGDQLVRAGSGDPAIRAHAARRPNGDLSVLLLNSDENNSRTVAIDYAGYTPSASAPTVHTFTNGATGVTTSTDGSATTRTLPPLSLTTLVLHPSHPARLPAAPGKPSASTTDRTATIAWPSVPGAVKYEIHRQLGTTSEQWGETPGTSFTAANLDPGSRYTVNVLARDAAGALSWASPPLTVTTGSPAQSTCTVRLSNVTDWASGWVGNVEITNGGTQPIADWTLNFTWPTGLQQVSSGWNATWAQSGKTVTVTGSARIEPNATVSTGFVGAYTGPNIQPSAFTLNGTLCHTAS
ncbi:cellulose binding domain-containing protein [Lentzea aerocolonigenes]|uniref:cellulose binding domain-containing protein n=1 Tax=Lentzea aerocolonigenes TaxID=68170 RepID=UPI000AFC283A|nr:cellulose binding domain-containing protein [Lentzea aerocolonigenes]MCP2245871.1 Fibronectin type III domain-containing protein [Lentzea aerocolonigenes]